MQKVFINNRDNKKLAVVVEESANQAGLAFVMPGQGGFKEQQHIRVFIEAFLGNGYTVISFDMANTIGESEGNIEDASITSYYADLEDVINWAKDQEWYQEPFALAGHSLGGICIALFAEKYPDKISALAPLSTVVSGKLSFAAHPQEEMEEWKRTGWQERISNSQPGTVMRFPWSNMEDRLKYDILPEAHKLTMPVLLMAGDQDTSTPYKHQKIFYDALPGPKEIHLIKGSQHTFREPEHLEQIKGIFKKWIEEYASIN